MSGDVRISRALAHALARELSIRRGRLESDLEAFDQPRHIEAESGRYLVAKIREDLARVEDLTGRLVAAIEETAR